MKHSEQWLLGAAIAAGGILGLAQSAPAGDPGISVYTWTDAQGTTHFSDAPRKDGPAQRVTVPAPAPPDRTTQAADRAWLARLDRDTQARLAREAAQRRAETAREAAIAVRSAQQAEYEAQPVAYVPIFPPHRRHFRRGHGHRRHHGSWSVSTSPLASFPQNSLPSSFPPGLPSSFPGYLPSSFPEMQNSPFSPSPPR